MNFDCIAAFGCSFVEGAAIENKEGQFVGPQYRFSKVIADHYNLPEINSARSGFGNKNIIRTVYEFIKNTEYKNPLVLIGTSGITRKSIYSNFKKEFYDHHIFDYVGDFEEDKERLKRRSKLFLGKEELYEKLGNWLELEQKYFFNLDVAQDELERDYVILDGYLRSKNIKYIIFNSISNDFKSIPKTLPFYNFKAHDTDLEVWNVDDPTFILSSELKNCWYHYLRVMHYENINKDFNDITFRNRIPPYGRYFSAGHPSPGAHRDFANDLIKHIDENYS